MLDQDKAVLAELQRCNTQGEQMPSGDELAASCRMSQAAVYRSLRRLEKAGFIRRTKRGHRSVQLVECEAIGVGELNEALRMHTRLTSLLLDEIRALRAAVEMPRGEHRPQA